MRYKLYQNKNRKSLAYGKWYARGLHEVMTFAEFVKHMAEHHCVYSEATIRGVLLEMEICLREQLLEGKAVYFDELGIFKLGLQSRGVASPAEFNVRTHVPAVRMNLFLGARFRAKDLRRDVKLVETDVNTVTYDDDEPSGENATQAGNTSAPSGDSGSGSGNSGNSGSGSQSQQNESGNYNLTIARSGSGTSTVKNAAGVAIVGSNTQPSGSTIYIEIVPAEGHVPTARLNYTDIPLTNDGGTYKGSFQMPARGSVLELYSGSNGSDSGFGDFE